TRPRGHTSLTGAVEAQLAVKRDDANNVIVTVEAMKDGAEGTIVASRLEVEEVGTDEDGDIITSCVVVPTEAQQTTIRHKPSTKQRLALDALTDAVLSHGRDAPAAYQLPTGTKVVTEDEWKTELFRRKVLDEKGKNPRSRYVELRNGLSVKKVI